MQPNALAAANYPGVAVQCVDCSPLYGCCQVVGWIAHVFMHAGCRRARSLWKGTVHDFQGEVAIELPII